MMKKWLAFLLLLALPLCALAQGVDLVGEWFMTSVEMSGIAIPAQGMEGDLAFSLKEDGSAVLTASGQDISANWRVEGETLILEMDGEQMVMILREDGFAMDLGGGMMAVFGKEIPVMDDAMMNALFEQLMVQDGSAEAPVLDSSAAVQNSGPLEGSTWTLTSAVVNGNTIPAQSIESIGLSMMLMLHEDGQLTVNLPGGSFTGEWTEQDDELAIVYYDTIDQKDYGMTLALQPDGSYGGELEGVKMNFTRQDSASKTAVMTADDLPEGYFDTEK